MFVTWKADSHELRGCIGTISPINLIEGLQQYSIKSALKDHRFSPIQTNELFDIFSFIANRLRKMLEI